MSTFNGHPADGESATESWQANTARLGKTALVVGGTVLAGYVLFRLLTSREETEEPRSPAPQEPTVPPSAAEELAPSPLLTAIKGAMVSFLLATAREKLHDFIAQFNQRTDASSRT